MALIRCPDCDTEVSDAASSCLKCGRPLHSTPYVPPSVATKNREAAAPSRTGFTITLSSLAVVLIASAVAVCTVPAFQIGKDISARCTVDGRGDGSCEFSNTGWTPGSYCASVSLVNKEDGTQISKSGAVCSGRIWPNDTVTRAFSMETGGCFLLKECTVDIEDLFDSTGPSSAKNPPPAASAPASASPADPYPGASQDVRNLITKEEGLNDVCRDSSGGDPVGQKACDSREVVLNQLKAGGWCWGNGQADQTEADKVFQPCTAASLAEPPEPTTPTSEAPIAVPPPASVTPPDVAPTPATTPPSEPQATESTTAPPVAQDAPASSSTVTTDLAYLSRPPPVYPPKDIRQHNQGTTTVTVMVGVDGKVTKVEVTQSSGFSSLDDAAVTAVKTWTFQPGTVNGVPVVGYMRVPINFALAD
jgi:TonB family protein